MTKDRLQMQVRKDWATQTSVSEHPSAPTHKFHINHCLKKNFDRDVFILNNANMFIQEYVEISSRTFCFSFCLVDFLNFHWFSLHGGSRQDDSWKGISGLYSDYIYSCCLHLFSQGNLSCSDVKNENRDRLSKVSSEKKKNNFGSCHLTA